MRQYPRLTVTEDGSQPPLGSSVTVTFQLIELLDATPRPALGSCPEHESLITSQQM